MSYRGVSGAERDFYELKTRAVEFYRVTGVPEAVEAALNELFLHQPGDVNGYLANYFKKLSAPPTISRLKGKAVYDAGGQLTAEAEIFCIVCNQEKSVSSAAVSGRVEIDSTSLDRNAESQEGVDPVQTAVRWIDGPLNDMLKGRNPCDQSEVDQIISDFFAACYQEEKEIREKEAESRSSSETEAASPSPGAKKKSAEKSKKNSSTEKLLPPVEPTELVLPGSSAVGSVSLAVAKTGAQIRGVPLYQYIAALKNPMPPTRFHVPVALVTLLSCGKNSPGKLNLLEEVILIPKAGQPVREIFTMTLELQKEMMRIINSSTKAGVVQVVLSDSGAPAGTYDRPEQPLDLVSEACANSGLALGTEVHLALNCAAGQLMDYSKGKYEVTTGVWKSPDELVELYQALIKKFPAVVALIDPFRREDAVQWEKLSDATGGSCALLSDIAYNPKASPLPGVRGHIVKHAHETTVSDLICTVSEHRGSVLMGTTCSEPCSDDSLSDIAVGLGLDYVKLGGLSGAERMTKYNRLISIEEELAQQGILVFQERRPPLFTHEPQDRSSPAGSPSSHTAPGSIQTP
ncbi:enolase 4 [Antennarius striatus]|uniref:enolase 4 n=1 Tax=Antennarius striatus TaxID=241820 RepID=UPI0035B0A32E